MAAFVIISLALGVIDTWQNHMTEEERQSIMNNLTKE